MNDEPKIAVFVDFENLALGVKDLKGAKFRIELIIKRLLEKGRLVYKRAYCDWSQYQEFVREFHQLGIELVDIPRSRASGKNSADIRMVVDAIDLCYAKTHIDVFALLTGDSDFSPLVSKLKENDKRVLGCGVRNSTSNILAASCDEFVYYDDLIEVSRKRSTRKTKKKTRTSKKQQGVDRIVEMVESLQSDYDSVWGSMVKQAVKRVYPDFSEAYHGFGSFSAMLEEAEKQGLLKLDFDEGRGNYKVATAAR
ncbi:MAG: NYN domain-containing protein [Gammaproteobacteria bacterium]|nr:NYN domain-containing protein [Gammaproteobacteria bacterium]